MDDKTFDDPAIADEWIGIVESSGTRDKDIHPILRKWTDLASPSEILEIGSGQGICSDNIDLTGRQYIGVEPSAFLVDRANHLYRSENRSFKLGNAYSLPASDTVFDAAFSVLVFHLLEDLEKASSELSRVLRTNGHFLIITANPNAFSLWKNMYHDPKVDGCRIEGEMQFGGKTYLKDIMYVYPLDKIAASLKSAGLTIQETKTFRTSESSHGQEYLISITGRKL
jgi:SAM-dependent methyltransferase